jgi:hypothetical protein
MTRRNPVIDPRRAWPPAARRSLATRRLRGCTGGALRHAPAGSRLLLPLALLSLMAVGAARAADPPHVPIPGGLQGKTCYECHVQGVAAVSPLLHGRSRRYSLAGAFVTYMESPHGRLRRLGDMRAPMCEDCHYTREWKDILPADNPDSPINPRNEPRVCARCHGKAMLTAKVAQGSMHLELRHRSLVPGAPLEVRYGFLPGLTEREWAYYIGPFDITAWVSVLFLVLTVGTLVAFSAYMVVDLIRKLKERREAEEVAGSEASHHDD